MEQKNIRLLRTDEIECRIGTISEKGLTLLLYKDARADMKILDETYGPLNWQRTHEMIGGNLYCTVSVWNDDRKQWISKMDVGTESYTEKEKGQASDSFKRACVSVGVGRELYTAPFIWINAAKVKIEKKTEKNDKQREKLFTYDKFRVTDISYNDSREIIGLTIANQSGEVVYCLQEKKAAQKPARNVRNAAPTKGEGYNRQNSEPGRVQEINTELARTGVVLDTVLSRYGVSSIQEMDDATYKKAISGLKRTKTKAA